jgi:LCP family protein required for cell wall assembly
MEVTTQFVRDRPGSPRLKPVRGGEDGRARGHRMLRWLTALVAALVVGVTGFGWATYHHLVGGITLSQVLGGGTTSSGGAQNILIMGLDSRLDEHGRPLPQDVYAALHAGDESSGGYNANVLIVLHVPADDGPVTAFSIPRDDYVQLAGCPIADCKGKVKQSYGLAYQRALNSLAASGADTDTDPTVLTSREQRAREAGRKAEIDTVRDLLGIPIDHFVEVTLAAFLQIAKVVEPITVCLTGDTSDSYSGADFHQGVQRINAAQAMAFVRQRRDENDGSFTDLDRTRRQQAFLVSLVNALRKSGALSSPSGLSNLLRIARDNVAVDADLDLAGFTARAAHLQNAPISLYTLPISEFGQDSNGSDVNLVDVATIRKIVHDRVSSDTPAAPMASSTTTASAPTALAAPAVLDVVNAATRDGLAAAVEDAFASRGFTRGNTSTAPNSADASTIEYGPGTQDAAQLLANELHLTATASDAVPAGSVRLTVGAQFPAGEYMSNSSHSAAMDASAKNTPVAAVSATGAGTSVPAPTDLSQMTATDIACVK